MGNGFRLAVYDYFLGLVALGVVYIFKMISELLRPSQKEETALDILKKRYAKGRSDQGRI